MRIPRKPETTRPQHRGLSASAPDLEPARKSAQHDSRSQYAPPTDSVPVGRFKVFANKHAYGLGIAIASTLLIGAFALIAYTSTGSQKKQRIMIDPYPHGQYYNVGSHDNNNAAQRSGEVYTRQRRY